MAYVDLISQESYGQYNVKIAHQLGLTTAVYLSCITYICSHVVTKKTYDAEGFFQLDRDFVFSKTSLDIDTQIEIDSVLEKIGFIEKRAGETNCIRISMEQIANFIVDDKVKIPKYTLKIKRDTKQEGKSAILRSTMKKCLKETDPDLLVKYQQWVDSVYDTKRFLNKAKIELFMSKINAYTTDKKIKLALLDVAITTGYDTAEWVINKHTGAGRQDKATMIGAKQEVSTGFGEETF